MGQAKEILQGFLKLIFKDEDIEPTAKERLAICFECPIRTEGKCDKSKGGCGCLLAAKTRSVNSKCPLDKW